MKVALCSVAETEIGSMKRIEITFHEKPMRFCVINLGDEVYVIDDRCTHADFSLSEGFLDEAAHEVECPKHSAVFDIQTGVAKCLPATQPVKTYKAEVENGNIFIEIEELNV